MLITISGLRGGNIASDRSQMIEQFPSLRWRYIGRKISMNNRISQLRHTTKPIGCFVLNKAFLGQNLNGLNG